MDVACDCDAMHQIELSIQKSQAELESQKRSIFSRPKLYSFGTATPPGELELNSEWKPKFMQYSKESSRLASFATWPKQMNPKPEELAKAGFFYEGVSDTCRCFHCGLIVHNWEVDDNAVEQHFRHSRKCNFVQYLM